MEAQYVFTDRICSGILSVVQVPLLLSAATLIATFSIEKPLAGLILNKQIRSSSFGSYAKSKKSSYLISKSP